MFNIEKIKEQVKVQIKENILSTFNLDNYKSINKDNLLKEFEANGFQFFRTESNLNDYVVKMFKQTNNLMGGAIMINVKNMDFIIVSDIRINNHNKVFAVSNNKEVEDLVEVYIKNESKYKDSKAMEIFDNEIFSSDQINIGTKANNILVKFAYFEANGVTIPLPNKTKIFIENLVEGRGNNPRNDTWLKVFIFAKLFKHKKHAQILGTCGIGSLENVLKIIDYKVEQIIDQNQNN